MTEPPFTAGQRVYHCQSGRYGAYVRPDFFLPDTSFVTGDDGEDFKVPTAQLVPADEIEENA